MFFVMKFLVLRY